MTTRPVTMLLPTLLLILGGAGAVGCPGSNQAVFNGGFEDIASESPFNEFTFGPLT